MIAIHLTQPKSWLSCFVRKWWLRLPGNRSIAIFWVGKKRVRGFTLYKLNPDQAVALAQAFGTQYTNIMQGIGRIIEQEMEVKRCGHSKPKKRPSTRRT